MATPLQPGMIVESRIYCQDAEQVAINVHHWRVDTVGLSPATDLDLATAIDGLPANDLIAVLSSASNYRGTAAQIIWPLPRHVPAVSKTGAAAGAVAGVSLPRQTAGFTRWKTALTGRQGQGRSYWPFPAQADNATTGFPSAGYIARILTLSTDLFLAGGLAIGGRTATLHLAVYNRVTHVPTDITTFAAPTEWATQRRRGSFGRGNTLPI